MTGNRWVLNIAKSVAPGQDWTGEAGSWMGSLEIYLIANEDKNIVRKQRGPFDEDEGAIDADADANAVHPIDSRRYRTIVLYGYTHPID